MEVYTLNDNVNKLFKAELLDYYTKSSIYKLFHKKPKLYYIDNKYNFKKYYRVIICGNCHKYGRIIFDNDYPKNSKCIFCSNINK